MNTENEIIYGIALSQIFGVGSVLAKQLISYCGSAENVFKTPKGKLLKIQGIGEKVINAIQSQQKEVLQIAEKEWNFIQKNNIDILFYYDKKYPKRLQNCIDAPMFIFAKGNYNFNEQKIINIIGTRHATEYGKKITEQIVDKLATYNISLVSGLAYGIDIAAHKAALKNNIQNIAVLAHGLDRIYPAQHKSIAEKLQENGAIVSEYLSETIPDRNHFPERNRIVAGMTDATIVIESAKSGGAMITAEIANNYNRDVFAIPGKITDEFSGGCNYLIQNHKAQLITDANDIIKLMNWDIAAENEQKKIIKQAQLFLELNTNEQLIYDFLKQTEVANIDEINSNVNLPISQISVCLLELEMNNIITAYPGKIYKIN